MNPFKYLLKAALAVLAFLPALLSAQQVATKFLVTEAGGSDPLGTTTWVSGQLSGIRITALDDNGDVVTGYARDVTVTLPDPYTDNSRWVTVTVPAASFVGGEADNIDITPIHAGTNNRRIAVTDGNIATYNANNNQLFSISPASFFAAHPGTYSSFGSNIVVSGSNLIRIVALNVNNTVAQGYTGDLVVSSPGLAGDVEPTIAFGGIVDNVRISFTAAGLNQSIDITDGVVTTTGASRPQGGGSFTVRPSAGTAGIAAPAQVSTAGSVLRPGGEMRIGFELKSSSNATVTSADTVGTISRVELFNTNASIVYYADSPSTTPGSTATDGANGSVNFIIPDYFPPGSYTLRINSGINGPRTDTTIVIGGLPDLAISRFDYAPGTYEAGEAIRFDMVWRNLVQTTPNDGLNARVPADQDFRTELHLSRDDTFGNEDDILVWVYYSTGNDAGAPLLPGQAVSVSGEFTLPENLPGTYYLLAKVNSEGGRSSTSATSFSSGFTEVVGPTPPSVLSDGNNIILPSETQKLTILPRTSTETTRLSLSSDGSSSQGNSDLPAIATDAAYVAFQSLAPLAGAGSSNGLSQIFRKNPSNGSVELVSIGTNGLAANGASGRPSISADGRYVVFESTATNLQPGDTNGFSDIYLRDMQIGVTRRLSIQGLTQANSGSFKPSISADGRFIVFSSTARNLVGGTSAGLSQVYIYDRDVSGSGVFDNTGNTSLALVSQVAGVAGVSSSTNARISANGNFVVYSTKASNLLGGVSSTTQIVRWDRIGGSNLIVSSNSGSRADGDADFSAINADGSRIAFVSRALNLTSDTAISGVPHVFRATVAGGIVTQVVRINGAGNVEPNNPVSVAIASPDLGSFEPSISADGNLIAFASESNNLLPAIPVRNIDRTYYTSNTVYNYADDNRVADVYLADLTDPVAPKVQRASVSSFGYEATIKTVGTTFTLRVPSSRAPAISPDGRYVVFASDAEGHNGLAFGATNFDYSDTNGSRDIYLYDRKTDVSNPSNLPSVSLLNPAALTLTEGTNLSLVADASSVVSSIARVEFYANNILVGTSTVPSVNGSGYFAFNWQIPLLGNGNRTPRIYEIAAIAVDATGSRSVVSNIARLTVTPSGVGSAPSISLADPSSGGLIRAGSTIRINATASDTDRNLTGVQFFVNGVSVGDVTRALAADQTSGVYSCSWSNGGAGYYTIVAQARDASGNRVLSQPITIQIYPNVNPGIPAVSLTTPSTSSVGLKLGSSLRLVAGASDAGGSVSRVQFYANGGLVSQTTSAPYEGSFTPGSVGVYEVYAVAVDNDGNESVSPQVITVTVTSDVTPVLGTGSNDLFVNQVLLDGEQNVQLNPGDPIRYTVAYGRLNPGSSPHQQQSWRTSVYLSTDGDPDNRNNFLLDFFDGSYPRDEPTGRFELTALTDRLPYNFTGTYYLIATIRVTSGTPDTGANNNTPSVFVTSATRVTILPVDSPTVSRVSVNSNGNDANEFSESGTISSDGRYIVFHSEATDLVASPTAPAGISQVYLRDTVTGVTTLISQRGGVAGNAESKYGTISVAGLDQGGARQYFVAYQSAASNLVGGTGNTDTNQQTDVFLYEIATGITTRISVPSGAAPGLQANGGSFLPSISGNGDYVVFESDASNLVASGSIPDTNGQRDIYLYNRNTKAISAISTTSAGVFGAGASTQAQISEDASTVVFRSYARNLAGNLIVSSSRSIIYAKALGGSNPTNGVIQPISVLPGVAPYTVFSADAFDPAVSANGRYIAFSSRAVNIPNSDGLFNTSGKAQVYVVNRAVNGGVFDQVGNVSLSLVSAGRDPITGALAFGDADSLAPTISGNGRYIGYRTEAGNLQVETVTRSDGVEFATDDISSFKDTNNTSDVYLRDTGLASISVTSPGAGYPAGPGIEVIINGGGGTGARALAIIENGVVSRVDILDSGSGYITAPTVTIPSLGTTQATAVAKIQVASERVSVSQFGQQTIGLIGSTLVPNSRDLKLSSDGRYLLFTSDAANTAGFIFGKSNQLPLDSNGKRDIFLVDRKVGSYVTPIEGSAPTVAISMDVRPVSFGSSRVIRAEAFDGGDFDQATNTAVAGKIKIIEIYANNQLLKRYVPSTPTSADATSAIWLAPLSAGAVQLYAIAEDADGNRTRSQPVNLTVSLPPSLEPTVTLQASATTLNIGQTVTLTATASDPDNGVKAVKFYGNGSLIGTDSAAPYVVTFTPSSSGTYELLAVAYDNITGGDLDLDPIEIARLRNSELSNAVNLLVLAPPAPTVKLISPAAATTTTVGSSVFIEVSAESNNNNATISTVEIYGNGQSIGTASRVGFTSRYRLTWKPTVAGVFNISAVATDTQQSRSSSAAKAVTVNSVTGTAPFVVITNPVVDPAFGYATLYTSETTNVQIQALDLDGTVASVQLYISGRLLGSATRNGANFEYMVDGSTLPAGLYELVALATDNSGNITASAGVSVLVTARAASVSIVRPELPILPPQLVDVKRGQPVPFLFKATTPDSLTRVTQVALSVNGVTLPTLATAVGTLGDYSLIWTPDTTGIFTVVAVATDSLGATVNSSELQVRVTEPVGTSPVVQVISPVSTGGTNPVPATAAMGSQVFFVATATDNTAVTSVNFYVDGILITPAATRQGTTNQWVLNATLSGAPFDAKGVGSYAITAMASDADGNRTQSSVVTLNVTPSVVGSAPSGSLVFPAASSVQILGQAIALQALANDADGAIASVAFYANGVLVDTDTTAPFTGTWTPTVAGNYNLVLLITDAQGMSTVTAPVSVTVTAALPPSITLAAPAPGSISVGQSTVLSATATPGAGASISQVEFFANGVSLGIDQQAPFNVTYTPSLDGVYLITASVTDNFGNTKLSSSQSLTVTSVIGLVPTVSVQIPSVALTTASVYPFRATASDSDGTVTAVEFFINGSGIGAGVYDSLSRTWIAPTTNFSTLGAGTYTVTAIATDNSGNRSSSTPLSVTVTLSNVDGVFAAALNEIFYASIGRNATDAEQLAYFAQFGSGAADYQIAAALMQTSAFDSTGAIVISAYQAVFGEYPNFVTYQNGLQFINNGGTTASYIDALYASGEYLAKFGALPSFATAINVERFAVTVHSNLTGVIPSAKIKGTALTAADLNLTAAQLADARKNGSSERSIIVARFSRLGTDTTGSVVASYILSLTGTTQVPAALLKRSRVAGVILALNEPDTAISLRETSALSTYDLLDVAELYGTGTTDAAIKPIFRQLPTSTSVSLGSELKFTAIVISPASVAGDITSNWTFNRTTTLGFGTAVSSQTPVHTFTYTVAAANTGNAGTYGLSVSNRSGTTAAPAFTASITPIVPASLPGVVTLQVGVFYSVDLGADVAGMSYVAKKLPKGLVLNAATGVISGVPTKTGSFTVEYNTVIGKLSSVKKRTTFVVGN